MIKHSIRILAGVQSCTGRTVYHTFNNRLYSTAKPYTTEPMEFTWNRPETTPNNAIQYILNDHKWFKGVLAKLKDQEIDLDQKKRIVDKLIKETSQHAEIEEYYLWPLLTERLGQPGTTQYNRLLRLEEDIKIVSKKIMDTSDDETFNDEMIRLESLIMEDIVVEETQVLPALREVLSDQETADIETKMKSTRPYTPTRPHPNAPLHSPLNRLNQVTGVIDHLKDKITGRDV
jgi:hypothetical protein